MNARDPHLPLSAEATTALKAFAEIEGRLHLGSKPRGRTVVEEPPSLDGHHAVRVGAHHVQVVEGKEQG